MMRAAISSSWALRSSIFLTGDLEDLVARELGLGLWPGWPEPLATPAAFLMSSAAGGVFVTKVNERSS